MQPLSQKVWLRNNLPDVELDNIAADVEQKNLRVEHPLEEQKVGKY